MAESIDRDLFSIIKNGMDLEEIDIVNYSPLTLAYIGDAIYELVIRTIVVDEANRSVNKLHKDSASLVKADAQAYMIDFLQEQLSEEEMSVYKRGRNAKSYTKAKNATYASYRNATGFEALMGYLYLSGKSDRMMELIKSAIDEYRGTDK